MSERSANAAGRPVSAEASVGEPGAAADLAGPADAAGLTGGAITALAAGVALVLGARAGAAQLLAVVAVLQGLLVIGWVLGTGVPGRLGGAVIGAAAAAGADVVVSVWPHGRLGVELAVLGLAVPLMFAHQLSRGATRADVVSSLSATALLALAVAALPALLQLRHEFAAEGVGGRVVAASVGAVAAGLITGCLLDLVAPLPRFDDAVPRGLLGVLGAAAAGAAVADLLARDVGAFAGGRSVLVGCGLGALAGLLSVAASFTLYSANRPASALGARLRPVIGTLLPIAVIAPIAFLLCLSVRA